MALGKRDIYRLLDERGIAYEAVEHAAVYTVEEADALRLPYPETGTKNLFLRDDKHRSHYLVTLRDHKAIDLKAFAREQELRRLSFASAEDLQGLLGLTPGSVTPLGLLNDKDRRVALYLDEEFARPGELIGVHPNDNTATVWLPGTDLVRLIRDHGNPVHLVRI